MNRATTCLLILMSRSCDVLFNSIHSIHEVPWSSRERLRSGGQVPPTQSLNDARSMSHTDSRLMWLCASALLERFRTMSWYEPRHSIFSFLSSGFTTTSCVLLLCSGSSAGRRQPMSVPSPRLRTRAVTSQKERARVRRRGEPSGSALGRSQPRPSGAAVGATSSSSERHWCA